MIRAYNKDGKEIPFAIEDDDYTIDDKKPELTEQARSNVEAEVSDASGIEPLLKKIINEVLDVYFIHKNEGLLDAMMKLDSYMEGGYKDYYKDKSRLSR